MALSRVLLGGSTSSHLAVDCTPLPLRSERCPAPGPGCRQLSPSRSQIRRIRNPNPSCFNRWRPRAHWRLAWGGRELPSEPSDGGSRLDSRRDTFVRPRTAERRRAPWSSGSEDEGPVPAGGGAQPAFELGQRFCPDGLCSPDTHSEKPSVSDLPREAGRRRRRGRKGRPRKSQPLRRSGEGRSRGNTPASGVQGHLL